MVFDYAINTDPIHRSDRGFIENDTFFRFQQDEIGVSNELRLFWEGGSAQSYVVSNHNITEFHVELKFLCNNSNESLLFININSLILSEFKSGNRN